MTFRTQHIPGPRSVERGRCRDYPWMIVDPEIGEIGRMLDHADAVRAANGIAVVAALGFALTLIQKYDLDKALEQTGEHELDLARLLKARGAYNKVMMDLANRSGGEGAD